MTVYANPRTTGGTISDASQITTGVLDIARIPTITAAKVAGDVATQPELDAAIATRQPADADLSSIASISPSDGAVIVGVGSVWNKKTLAEFRAMITPILTTDVNDAAVTYPKLAPEVVDQLTAAVLALLPNGGGSSTSIPDAKFANRLALANTVATPIIFAGSSSTYGDKAGSKPARFVDRTVVGIQLSHPSGRPSGGPQPLETYVQDNPGGVGGFGTPNTMVGVHGYNVGKAGSKSNDFLLNADIPSLGSLNPAAWVIMVGSNDCAEGVAVATFKTNLAGKIALIKANMPTGASYAIYLVHQYLRPASRTPTYAWALYGAAMKEIADADPATIKFLDMHDDLPGVPGASDAAALATGYIDADLIHMNAAGHGVWAAAEYLRLFGTALPPGAVTYTSVTTVSGADNFSRAVSTSALGATSTGALSWVQNVGTWGINASGKAYMSAGSGGVATIPAGLTDGEISFDLEWPTAAGSFVGVRGRAIGSSSAVSLYGDKNAGTLNLSTIIGGSNQLLTTAVTLSSLGISTTGGTIIACKLVMNGTAISGYANGNLILSGTLSASQMASISGSDIGLRQVTAGTTNGSIDNLAYTSTFTSTGSYSLVMPTGNLPGWDSVAEEDFAIDVASPNFLTTYGPRGFKTYNNFGDTAWNKSGGVIANSGWYSDKILSVSNHQLVAAVGWDPAVGKNLVSYIMPRGYTGQVMGRVDFLLDTDVVAGYKIVPLWWPVSDIWNEGEIDFPESGTLGTTFKGFIHDTVVDPKVNILTIDPVFLPGNPTAPRLNVKHVFSQRWTEAEISFWMDGIKVGGILYSEKPAGFPDTPMRFGFQIEALDLSGSTPISQTAKGNVRIGWVKQYTRNLATA